MTGKRAAGVLGGAPMLGVLALLASGACARVMGRQAVSGAVEGAQEKAAKEEGPGREPAEIIAGHAMEGAIKEMSNPEQVARLRKLVDAMVQQALQTALTAALGEAPGPGQSAVEATSAQAADAFREAWAKGVANQVGSDAQGPLSTSVAALANRAGAAAATGAVQGLLAACPDEDPSCVDRRLAELSHSSAVGFANGLRDRLGLSALIAAFLIGVLTTLAVLWTWSLYKTQRRLRHPATPEHV